MSKIDQKLEPKQKSASSLDELARQGERQMSECALRIEVEEDTGT